MNLYHRGVTQRKEYRPTKPEVGGSSPFASAKKIGVELNTLRLSPVPTSVVAYSPPAIFVITSAFLRLHMINYLIYNNVIKVKGQESSTNGVVN